MAVARTAEVVSVTCVLECTVVARAYLPYGFRHEGLALSFGRHERFDACVVIVALILPVHVQCLAMPIPHLIMATGRRRGSRRILVLSSPCTPESTSADGLRKSCSLTSSCNLLCVVPLFVPRRVDQRSFDAAAVAAADDDGICAVQGGGPLPPLGRDARRSSTASSLQGNTVGPVDRHSDPRHLRRFGIEASSATPATVSTGHPAAARAASPPVVASAPSVAGAPKAAVAATVATMTTISTPAIPVATATSVGAAVAAATPNTVALGEAGGVDVGSTVSQTGTPIGGESIRHGAVQPKIAPEAQAWRLLHRRDLAKGLRVDDGGSARGATRPNASDTKI